MANLPELTEMVLRQQRELSVLTDDAQTRIAEFMMYYAPLFGRFYSFERKLILKFLIEQDEIYDKLNI